MESDVSTLSMCAIHQSQNFLNTECDVAALNKFANSKYPHNPRDEWRNTSEVKEIIKQGVK